MDRFVKWVRYEIRRGWWNLRQLLHLGVGYTVVMWKTIVGGRVGLASRLYARVWKPETGWVDHGLLGIRCVTDDFVESIVDYLQGGGSGIGVYKYHDCGTGTVAENQTDTTLGTPSGMAREVGTQVEGSGAYIYKSVATITSTISATTAITEHGLFNAASGGVLMDRTKFAAINLDTGNKIEFTYELQVIAGG